MQGVFSRGNSPVQQSTSIDSKSDICGIYGEDEGSLEGRTVVALDSQEAQKDFIAGTANEALKGICVVISGVFVATIILAITVGIALFVAGTTQTLLPVIAVLGGGSVIAVIAGILFSNNLINS